MVVVASMTPEQDEEAERDKDRDEISFLEQLLAARVGPTWETLTISDAKRAFAKDLAADLRIKRLEEAVEWALRNLDRLPDKSEAELWLIRELRRRAGR
jgi:hypothetical protein